MTTRRYLPATTPQRWHLVIGDYTSCGLSMREYRELKWTLLEYLVTCDECRSALRGATPDQPARFQRK